MIRVSLLSLLLAVATNGYADSAHECTADARAQAVKLLQLHVGEDEEIGENNIDDAIKMLPSLKNPAGKGLFDVLEIWGNVYKGRYRMHFIYALIEGDCTLMGQEILEYAKIYE